MKKIFFLYHKNALLYTFCQVIFVSYCFPVGNWYDLYPKFAVKIMGKVGI